MTKVLEYVALVHVDTFPNRAETLRLAARRMHLTDDSPLLAGSIATSFVEAIFTPFASTVRPSSRDLWNSIANGIVHQQSMPAALVTALPVAVVDPVDHEEFIPFLLAQPSQPLLLTSPDAPLYVSPDHQLPPSGDSSSQEPSGSADSSALRRARSERTRTPRRINLVGQFTPTKHKRPRQDPDPTV